MHSSWEGRKVCLVWKWLILQFQATVFLEVYLKGQSCCVCEEHVFPMQEPNLTHQCQVLLCQLFFCTWFTCPELGRPVLSTVLTSFRESWYFAHTETCIAHTKVIFIQVLQIFAEGPLLVSFCFFFFLGGMWLVRNQLPLFRSASLSCCTVSKLGVCSCLKNCTHKNNNVAD